MIIRGLPKRQRGAKLTSNWFLLPNNDVFDSLKQLNY
jgi:hypothetical protein